MGKRSGFSFFGLFKSKPKKVWNGEDYPRDDVFVNRAYKVWPSDEDRGKWVADPGIDSKATVFINDKTQFWCNVDVSNLQ